MTKLGYSSLALLLVATTSAHAQVRLPTNQPPAAAITPTGKAPVVEGAQSAAPTATGADALLRQAATQRQRGRKDLAAQALQRALRASPNNPAVLQRYATYAIQDGDMAAAQTWTDRLKAATSPRDSRVAALERDIKAANAPPVSVSPSAAPTQNVQISPPQPAPQTRPAPTTATRPQAPRPTTAPVQTAQAPRPATPAPPAASADPGGEVRANGFKSLNAGEIADADRYFNQALRLRGDDLDAAGGLGVVRLRQERFADARGLLERAIRGAQGQERWGEALRTAVFFGDLGRARNAYVAGRYPEAEAAARPLASGSHPNRVEAQILLGQALAAQGRAAEAEAAFRQATLLAPGRADAVTGLAQALADLGRFDEATRILRDLPGGRAAPIMADIERERAAELQRRGDSFGAGAALAASLQAAPTNAWTRLEYARFLIGQGQAQQANQVAAPLYTSSDPESLQAAALFSEARGRSDEAAALLSRIPAGSRNPAVRQLAARVDAQRVITQAKQTQYAGQPVQGVQMLRSYLSNNDASFAVKGQIAETLLDLGDTYQAGALALEAARSPPATFDPGEAQGFLTVLGKTGQDEAALALLQAAARQAQRSPAGQNAYRSSAAVFAAQRADRLRASGDYAQAFDTLSQAFAIAPRDPGLLAALGVVSKKVVHPCPG
ncbi:tetratricopeptide repeat protein [Phenylobacterium immobile]|uniref:tetratricopeptide repeat protein n=1 Tax=Phenylobacterium immobile TaxID=21 RepID=UPI000A4A5654|nr:tetratricopeptide repeat protein [Phenylobacterium immobile]